jgi:acyl transferase domain-containing protein
MDRLERLEKEHIAARRLHTSHAFHSSMMDPILAEFEDAVSLIKLSSPAKPIVSMLTGNWAGEDVARPEYWSRQLRRAVRFADGVHTLMQPGSPVHKNAVYIEAGPGNTLSTFVREITNGKAVSCLQSLPAANGGRSDTEEMLNTLGQAWAIGWTWIGTRFTGRNSGRGSACPAIRLNGRLIGLARPGRRTAALKKCVTR